MNLTDKGLKEEKFKKSKMSIAMKFKILCLEMHDQEVKI